MYITIWLYGKSPFWMGTSTLLHGFKWAIFKFANCKRWPESNKGCWMMLTTVFSWWLGFRNHPLCWFDDSLPTYPKLVWTPAETHQAGVVAWCLAMDHPDWDTLGWSTGQNPHGVHGFSVWISLRSHDLGWIKPLWWQGEQQPRVLSFHVDKVHVDSISPHILCCILYIFQQYA